MIFDLDKKNESSIAMIDETNEQLSYGALVTEMLTIRKIIEERQLVFCLCENKIGSLVGFLSLYDNKDVCLLLSAHIDRELLKELNETYCPSYYWMPTKMLSEFSFDCVHSVMGFSLCKTGKRPPQMHPQLSMLMTTSGTMGSPKLVRHKYGNIESNAKNVANIFGWTIDDRGIIDLPMQYTMGLNVITSHLYAGATVLLVESNLLSPNYWKFIKDQKGTNFTGVPYSYEILNKLRFQRMDLPYLHTLAEGGGKMSNALFETFSKYAEDNNMSFFATYGTTETSARLSFLSPNEAVTHIGSIGKAIPGGKLSLVDEHSNEITCPEVEGELKYEGPNVTMGYGTCIKDLLKGDDFRGSYLTGDIAKMDADGYFYIVGRKKRFLKLYGLRISLDQSEKIINEAFKMECICTGDDNKMRIYITDEALKDDVKNFIAKKTGLISKSFDINVISEIPRFENGKINYKQLP